MSVRGKGGKWAGTPAYLGGNLPSQLPPPRQVRQKPPKKKVTWRDVYRTPLGKKLP